MSENRPKSHVWGKKIQIESSVEGIRNCKDCGLQVKFISAGDAMIEKKYLVDGSWVKTMKSPACKFPKKGPKLKRELTEAQRMVFQAPLISTRK